MSDILSLGLPALVDGYRTGKISPRDAIAAILDAAERIGPGLNTFALIDRKAALADARRSETRWRKGAPKGPLDGVPFTVKDNIMWAGHPMRRGSPTTSAEPVTENAPAVDRLVGAGAIPWAKTTLSEYGWKGIGDSPLHGILRNPWDTRTTTGGSSGGAAAAAALGLGPLHLGTDGAGSIRIPASFCGVFGIKPTYGRVPAYPPSPFAIVSHVGPITRSVTDAAIMLGVIAGPDPRDMSSPLTPPQDYLAGLEVGIKGIRVAWSGRLGHVERIDPEVEALAEQAARAFEEFGATVEEADPDLRTAPSILETLWTVGAYSVLRGIPTESWAGIDPGLVAAAERGRTVHGADFVAAANARGPLYLAMERFHERYDLLLTPTLATTAVEGGRDAPADGRFGSDWLGWNPYTYPFNLTGQPAASVPCGLTEAGLPVGLQIVGPVGRDGLVLRAARAFEAARPWPRLSEPRIRH
jgi:aspartyl-tRNA(Asn)/glutamyl-tRNA(Gln) amidotransferase subunit A